MNTIPNSKFAINEHQSYPISGGCNTNLFKPQLPLGVKSYIFNARPIGPGLEIRGGVTPHNKTAESALLSIYQFKKGKSTNKYFFAQTEAGGVLLADETPPTTTLNDFGDSVYSDTNFTALPASWSSVKDTMIFSQGSGQHQAYVGTDQEIKSVFYKIGTQTARVLEEGIDYTEECRDPDTSYVTGSIVLDIGATKCLYVCSQTPAESLKFDFGTVGTNPLEDLTGYSETDSGSDITVTSTQISFDTMQRVANSWVSKDFGAGFFGDFEFDFEAEVTASSGADAYAGIFNIGNTDGTVQDMITAGAGHVVEAYYDGADFTVNLYDIGTTNSDSMVLSTTSVMPQYYFTINRTSTTLTLYIYSDSGRTSLVDTLTVTCQSTTWRYLIPLASRDSAGTTTITGYVKNLQYQGTQAVGVSSFRVGGWNSLTVTDGTTGATQDGTVSWTQDASEVPTYMFGQSGYWYKVVLATGVSVSFTIAELTYGADFTDLADVWDGTPVYAIECQVEQADGTYQTYASSSVTIGALAIGDYIYWATTDPCWAIYVGVGATPNETATTSLSAVEGYVHSTGAGADWTAVTSAEDGTNGLANSGIISWQQSTSWTPVAFNDSNKHLYWWRMKFDKAISDDAIISIEYFPFFDISKLGRTGNVSCAWKDRGVYTFKKFSRDLYVSASGKLNSLSGPDSAILTPGDGRHHPVVAAKKFHNELMVFQEEIGTVGGTITIFEGYNPASFGRYVLSSRLGTFHQKSVDVVEGNLVTTRRDFVSQTVAFFLSHEGVFMTDGQTIQLISSDIQNYFDTDRDECIRRGYEKYMFLKYDGQKKVLRLGLVSGSSATSCNIYPVYDIASGEWYFDEYPSGMKLTDFTELEAGSGDIHVLQYASSGTGRAYRANSGYQDDIDGDNATYVNAGFRMEFNNGGNQISIDEVVLRGTSNNKFTMTKKIYENNVLDSDETETNVMSSEDTNGGTFRERLLESIQLNHSFSLDVSWTVTSGETPSARCDLYDLLVAISGETRLN
jgi:hypothetical protein